MCNEKDKKQEDNRSYPRPSDNNTYLRPSENR